MTGCVRRALARPKRATPHPFDEQTQAQAVLRCIERGDWEVLHARELESLDEALNRISKMRGNRLHNLVRERLGLEPVERDWGIW